MTTASEPPTKRMRIAYHHRHIPRHQQQKLPPHEPSVLPDESIDKLLIDSIKSICEEQAAKLDIDEPVIESVALESLRNAAEEFFVKTCSKIRRSMTAARRTFPIATDFESAIDILSIPRPDDQLKPYKTPLDTNPQLLPTPPPDDPFHNHIELDADFLGPDLSNQVDLGKLSLNASTLPALPSAHTYRDSHVLSPRETDSRKVRELATEEGKLGEQALRKLAGAVKLDTALSKELRNHVIRAPRGPRRRHPALTEEAVFEETMRDLLKHEAGKFELGPIVTAEKGYRMPDDVQVKRKAAATSKMGDESSAQVFDASGQSKYNLLPPPRKPQVQQSDQMDIT